MIYLAIALTLILALGLAAWACLPATPAPAPTEAVDPTHPHRFIDHRDDAQRAADQAATNKALGLR